MLARTPQYEVPEAPAETEDSCEASCCARRCCAGHCRCCAGQRLHATLGSAGDACGPGLHASLDALKGLGEALQLDAGHGGVLLLLLLLLWAMGLVARVRLALLTESARCCCCC